MKTIKLFRVILPALFILLISASPGWSQSKGEVAEIKIKTSAVCGMCKTRIEKDLAYEKGITYVSLDLPSKDVTVKYKTSKTNPELIRKAITKIGYDADTLVADQKAYDKLPACCKKDAAPH